MSNATNGAPQPAPAAPHHATHRALFPAVTHHHRRRRIACAGTGNTHNDRTEGDGQEPNASAERKRVRWQRKAHGNGCLWAAPFGVCLVTLIFVSFFAPSIPVSIPLSRSSLIRSLIWPRCAIPISMSPTSRALSGFTIAMRATEIDNSDSATSAAQVRLDHRNADSIDRQQQQPQSTDDGRAAVKVHLSALVCSYVSPLPLP